MQGSQGRRRRRRLTPIALAAGVLGSAVLGLGATGTYSGLTATITNQTNTAGTGGLVMTQTTDADPSSTLCVSNGSNSTDNSVSCTTPNSYGGSSSLTPGGTASTTSMRIYDSGTLDPTGFTLTPGTCTSSNNATGTSPNNICNYLKLTLTCTPVTGANSGSSVSIYNAVTLSSISGVVKDLKAAGCLPLKNSGTYARLQFSVQLDSSAGNGVQNATGSQSLVWQFANIT